MIYFLADEFVLKDFQAWSKAVVGTVMLEYVPAVKVSNTTKSKPQHFLKYAAETGLPADRYPRRGNSQKAARES